MKQAFLFLIIIISLMAFGCGSRPAASNSNIAPAAASTPEDGYYQGKGVVTKINNDAGSVEIDHQEILKVMPAMKMEFNVRDKTMLKSVAVGDKVDFTLDYKQGQEMIIAIGKQ